MKVKQPAASREGKNAPRSLRNVGLFAGISGIELGLHAAGHETVLLCERDESAQAVLRARFQGVDLTGDIRDLDSLPRADMVSAGFPCQDLSQAGRTAGIGGQQSGLVAQVFRLIEKHPVRWLLLENVPFMLHLDKGEAMRFLTSNLAELGFTWAYRTVDAQSFGLPQRRQRVLLLASRTYDPREVLLVDDAEPPAVDNGRAPCGFSWTEGNTGLGWAVDAVPTIKGGSGVGIPSPPGIWMRHSDGSIAKPDIRDAERMQGFEADWTLPAEEGRKVKKGLRWKLVRNAVCVPMAAWVGRCLANPRPYDDSKGTPLGRGRSWPRAAWGRRGEAYAVEVSMFPVATEYQHLAQFLRFPTTPLSKLATAGFLSRARKSSLHFTAGFLDAVAAHLKSMRR